jgi:CRP-like cAMP-binding protein
VKKRESIFAEGERSRQICILLSGIAKLSFLGRDGERVLVSLVGGGEVFGVSSFLSAARRPFRCDAFSECVVGRVDPEEFVGGILRVPFADFSRFMDATVGRWWKWVMRYTTFVGLGLRDRLLVALLELAEKFGVQDSRGTILPLRLTHEDLADLVGASRQRVTEQMNELRRQGVILSEGRHLVLVAGRVHQLLQAEIA